MVHYFAQVSSRASLCVYHHYCLFTTHLFIKENLKTLDGIAVGNLMIKKMQYRVNCFLIKKRRYYREKSLPQVAMIRTVLNDNKPIQSLTRLFALFQTSLIFFNFIHLGNLGQIFFETVSIIMYAKKREIRKFYVVGVKQRQRNVQNSMMHVRAKLLFVNINIFFAVLLDIPNILYLLIL